MKIISADDAAIPQAIEVFNNDGVVAFATETVYGIGVRHGSVVGADRMREIKGRDADKPFQVLLPSSDLVSRYALIDNDFAVKLMEKFWPGPLTLVLPTESSESVGLRVPESEWLCTLMKEMDSAITATSANYSAQPAAVTAEEVCASIGEDVDLIIDGGPCRVAEASSVVGVGEGGIKIFREGAIKEEELLKACGLL